MPESWMFNPGGCCCDSSSPSSCEDYMGTNGPLYLTDVNGTYEMTWYPSDLQWKCCYTLTHPKTYIYSGSSQGECDSIGTGTIAVQYSVRCDVAVPGAVFIAQNTYQWNCSNPVIGENYFFSRAVSCSAGQVTPTNPGPAIPGTGFFAGRGVRDTAPTFGPFSATGTFANTPPQFPYYVVPIVGTVTVSS